jgi:hypothetical protein
MFSSVRSNAAAAMAESSWRLRAEADTEAARRRVEKVPAVKLELTSDVAAANLRALANAQGSQKRRGSVQEEAAWRVHCWPRVARRSGSRPRKTGQRRNSRSGTDCRLASASFPSPTAVRSFEASMRIAPPFPAFDKDVFEHSRRIERPSMRHKAAAAGHARSQQPRCIGGNPSL